MTEKLPTLVERLRDTASKGVSVWGDLQIEAANEIEILTAEREAYASAMVRMKLALAADAERWRHVLSSNNFAICR